MSSIFAGVADYIYSPSNIEENSNNDNSNSNSNSSRSSSSNSPRSSSFNTPRDGVLSTNNSEEKLQNDNIDSNNEGYVGAVKSYSSVIIGAGGEYIPSIGSEYIPSIGSEYMPSIGSDYIPSLESLYPTSIFGSVESNDDGPRKKSNSMHEWEKRSIEWESAMLKIRADYSRKEEIKNPKDKPLAGNSICKVPNAPTSEQKRNTWSDCLHHTFNCRIGPNYSWNGKKAPSPPSLMNCVGMEFIKCDKRIDNIGSKVNLPDEWNIETNNSLIPPIFIVNIQIPSENPLTIFQEINDGPGYTLTYYFQLKPETAESYKNLATATPAARLFAEYCMKAPELDNDSRSEHKGKFKVCVRCENIEEFGIPTFISQWNAKPALIKQTGTLIRGSNYIEMDINGHRFNSMAKGALLSLMPSFDRMVISTAFCIESRKDDEMPETVFGCSTWNKPDLIQTPTLDSTNV